MTSYPVSRSYGSYGQATQAAPQEQPVSAIARLRMKVREQAEMVATARQRAGLPALDS